jgi:ArsR family transcriptional regulator
MLSKEVNTMDYSTFASVFKALSDEKRLKIIDMLSHGSLCACKILEQFNFSQPALSQHMKVLVDSGLVRGVRVGNWMHYILVKEEYDKIVLFIQRLSAEKKESACEEVFK